MYAAVGGAAHPRRRGAVFARGQRGDHREGGLAQQPAGRLDQVALEPAERVLDDDQPAHLGREVVRRVELLLDLLDGPDHGLQVSVVLARVVGAARDDLQALEQVLGVRQR